MSPQKYIENILALTPESAFGRCKEITALMQEKFPGLKLIRGHYLCPVWGRRAHWWLVDENDDIIDPTAIQFPSFGGGTYLPWDETKPEPTGKCMNCGTYCFLGSTACSKECYHEICRYYQIPPNKDGEQNAVDSEKILESTFF